MSEYQYYEFQAVDRPLNKGEIAELRALSTRAAITPTRFQNAYNWGDFTGDPLTLMGRYLDAFVYVANWGTHQFMLRLPRHLFDSETARSYAVNRPLGVHTSGDFVIVEFTSEDEEEAGWVEDEEAESWMPTLLPLRSDVAAEDLRALYLAWLGAAQTEILDDEEIEPPVPPGLRCLSASLKALIDFLRIGGDLLDVATAPSFALPGAPSRPIWSSGSFTCRPRKRTRC